MTNRTLTNRNPEPTTNLLSPSVRDQSRGMVQLHGSIYGPICLQVCPVSPAQLSQPRTTHRPPHANPRTAHRPHHMPNLAKPHRLRQGCVRLAPPPGALNMKVGGLTHASPPNEAHASTKRTHREHTAAGKHPHLSGRTPQRVHAYMHASTHAAPPAHQRGSEAVITSIKCLLEVEKDVLGRLETDREPHESVR